MDAKMEIKQFIKYAKEHILSNKISDDLATFTGGFISANILSKVTHALEVAVYGFIGGAFGLIGKLLIQYVYDKFKKK